MSPKLMPFMMVLVLAVAASAFPQQMVVVTPEETDEILANPGIGWETFHRTSKQDKCLPSWIFHQQGWQYNQGIIERRDVKARPQDSGKAKCPASGMPH